MTEFEFIDEIGKIIPDNEIGDDCAIIPFQKINDKNINQLHFLVATDTINENIHFSTDYFSMQDIGHKALAVNLSDIAACGGTPLNFSVSITLPTKIDKKKALKIFQGFKPLCDKYSLVLLGGDTVAGNSLSITVTVNGYSETPLHRKKAMPGDYIYLTGELGTPAYALSLLKRGKKPEKQILQTHLNPVPEIETINNLMKKYKITSCIDVSDGFSQDLYHLKHELIDFQIFFDKIPINKVLKKLSFEERMELVLFGGEDFKLIFTSPDNINETSIFKIGNVIKADKSILICSNKTLPLLNKGYDHFV